MDKGILKVNGRLKYTYFIIDANFSKTRQIMQIS